MTQTKSRISATNVHAADWVLRISAFLFAGGLAIAFFTRKGSALGEIALMHWAVSHDAIFLTERIAALAVFALAASLFVYPTSAAVLLIAAAALTEAYAGYVAGGQPFVEYRVFAEALRYLAPLALLPLVLTQRLLNSEAIQQKAAEWILRIGLAVVFFTHGLEALGKSPVFIDLILGSAGTFGFSLTETTARYLLTAIAWVDFAVAALVLVRPSRPLLAWLCFWGLITALSRPVSHGFASYPEVLLRAPHFLAPVALWLLVFAAGTRTEPKTASAQTKSSEGRTTDSCNSPAVARSG